MSVMIEEVLYSKFTVIAKERKTPDRDEDHHLTRDSALESTI